jgi:hypothetical protein
MPETKVPWKHAETEIGHRSSRRYKDPLLQGRFLFLEQPSQFSVSFLHAYLVDTVAVPALAEEIEIPAHRYSRILANY